jgi:hypothetical protein
MSSAGIIIVVLVALNVVYLSGSLGTSNNNTPTPG